MSVHAMYSSGLATSVSYGVPTGLICIYCGSNLDSGSEPSSNPPMNVG